MRTIRNLILLISIVLVAGCSADEQDIILTPDFAEYVKAAALTWNDAWASGDADIIADQYAENAMLLPPGSEPISGRAAIRDLWEGAIAMTPGFGITSVESGSNGDLAYERGTYLAEGPDGEHLDHGKYLVVWTLVDGEWKMLHDMWNSSMQVSTEAPSEE